MAQKFASKDASGRWGRTLKRLIPQPKKPLLWALIGAMALCALGGYISAQTSPMIIARSSNTQADLSNTQDELDSTNKSQAQLEDKPQTNESSGKVKDADNLDQTATTSYCIHIDGAVVNPGVYRLTGDVQRVSDAVDAAGGLSEEADTGKINLAEPLVDGAKIHIPLQGEEVELQGSAQVSEGSSTALSSGNSNNSSVESGNVLVNLNTATAQELQTLPGIGEATAQAILEDREAHGSFSSPEDLMRVSGIGEKKYAKLKDKVCI